MTPEQLKASILQYAIQGKLVEQRPEEGTAEELYQQIQDAKQKLTKEGKFKKEKHLDEIEEGEIPFDVPESWKWVRIGKIVYSVTAGGDKPSDFSETKDVKHPVPVVANGVTNDGIIGYTSQVRAKAGTITIAGRGTIGFSLLRNYDYCPVVRLIVVDIPPMLCPEYLQYVIQALPEKSVGTSIPQLTVPMLLPKVIPLPPLEEQHRIVAKIEELLPFVDRYAASYEKLEQFNAKFPEDMKKSILQYAIQGKLVEQRPEEGTAEDLYKAIQEEKKKMIKAGKIKKEKPLAEITEDEMPFDIPDSWKWVRISTIGITQTGNTPKKSHPEYFGSDIPFLGPGDIQNGIINYENQGLSDEGKEYGRITLANSILQVCIGGSIGKCALVDREVAFNQQINSIYPLIANSEYVYHILDSSYFKNYMKDNAGGTATPIINRGLWDAIVIPLPPLKEQERIVAKIKQLLPFCERLIK